VSAQHLLQIENMFLAGNDFLAAEEKSSQQFNHSARRRAQQ